MHKHLGHALAQSSLAAVLRALKTSAQVPGTQHLLRSCAMVLRLYVHIDETQSLFLAFDLYIILIFAACARMQQGMCFLVTALQQGHVRFSNRWNMLNF